MNWSETLENSELETLIPINTNGINIVNNKKWSHSKLPLSNKSESVITIPILKTLLREGRNSWDLVFLYSSATGGPPIAATIPNTPEKVPARKELKIFLFITQPKKEPTPAIKTINPTAIDKYFSDRFKSKKSPIGPPTNLPIMSGFTLEKSTSSFSR